MLRKISAGSPFLPGVRTALFCTFVLTLLSGCSGAGGGGGAVVSFPTATFTGPLSSMTEPETFDSIATTIKTCSDSGVCNTSSTNPIPRSSAHQITIYPIAGAVDIKSGSINLSFDPVTYLGGNTAVGTFPDASVPSAERLRLLLPGPLPASTLDWASYGVWSVTTGSPPGNVLFDGGALSFGVLTPLASAPKSGKANFSGLMDGLYVNAASEAFSLSGTATMNYDFARPPLKVIEGKFEGIAAIPITPGAVVPAGTIGTINFSAGISGVNFSGTATSTPFFPDTKATLTGPLRGSFYGPVAQEAGGVFQIKNVGNTEHAVGAFAVRK